MEKEWNTKSVVANGSLGVYCGYTLGKIYDGTFYSSDKKENYVLLENLKTGIPNTLRASLSPLKDRQYADGDKIRVRISYIFASGALNADIVPEAC